MPARSARRRPSSSSPRAGALPVLAHPYTLRLGDAALERFVERLAGFGLRGVECFRPDHDDAQRAFTRRLCAQLGLVPTGGSDWHGNPERPELGDAGPVPLPGGHARATRSRMSPPSG